MKKQFISVLLVFVLAISGFSGTYSGGDGSVEYPYRIAAPNDMNEIGLSPVDWDANFVLINDIDLSEYTSDEFPLIGSYPADPFTGIFDGNSHSISNFTYDVSGVHYIGLFSFLDNDALIQNLSLQDSAITAATSDFVGALAGLVQGGSLIRCSVIDSSVMADDNVGALAGKTAENTLIKYCGSNTAVSGDTGVGGLVGENRGTVSNSFATGTVSGTNPVGGLVGNDYMIVSNCYAAGYVTGSNRVGGLIGRQNTFLANEKTKNSYSATLVDCAGSDTGGFVGYEQSSISLFIGCFWDNQVNPGLDGIGNTSDPNVNGISSLTMRDKDTFTDSGWDFTSESANGTDDIWLLMQNQSYPCINFFPVGDFNTDGIVNFLDFDIFADNWLKELQ
ncbi:MAG: GLUG motif-containing protein [Planctomycetota bacterium]|jgi:hypothetical protein